MLEFNMRFWRLLESRNTNSQHHTKE